MSERVTDAELAEIEARANAATAGPWRAGDHPADEERIWAGNGDVLIYDEGGHTPEDARFIAAARTDVPRLVAEVRRLRSLFTEADAEVLGSAAETIEREFGADDSDALALADLARRIREAIGPLNERRAPSGVGKDVP